MDILNIFACIVVSAFGLSLIILAVVIVIKPQIAERFLNSFAQSARAHYIEQVVRLIFGVAIVICAPSMWYAELFKWFGWLLIVTAIGLMLIPWQWHQKFAKWATPMVIRHIKLYGIGAFVFGTIILYGLSHALLS